MDLSRYGAGLAPWLLVAACSPPAPPIPTPFSRTPIATSAALPPVPERRGPLRIVVAYPPTDAIVDVADSSFIFGSVGSGDAQLTINGQPVRVWPNGAWLAFLPFPSDTLARFDLRVSNATDSASLTYLIHRAPARVAPPPHATVWVDTLSLAPRGRVWLGREEYLPLSARASEGAEVRMRLSDGTIVPLVAEPEAGAGPEGVRVFAGVLRGRSIGPDPGPVLPAANYVMPAAPGADTVWAALEAISGSDTVRARWPLQVALLDSLPVLAELDDDTASAGTTDSTTIGRALPGGTYAWFFPTGTRVRVSGRRDGDVRLKLSSSAEAWVPAPDVRPLPAGLPIGTAVVGSAMLSPGAAFATLRVPVSRRLPFRIIESERALALRFYGAAGDVNWIRYGGSDSLVRRISWEQTSADEVTITVDLARPVWGYRTRWEGNDLLLDVRRPPVLDGGDPLSGRLIAVDPGHPPGGAIGPTGLREAEANLAVALELRRLLVGAGARVLMTRTEDAAVDLAPRVAMAERADADVLISIHNNALPDGIDPFTHYGTSVYYNHPGSIPLARDIQGELVRALRLPDLGIGRGDLALVRGTWMPSVLTEGFFMTLPDQEAALRTPRGRAMYARAVLDGLRRFLGERARDEAR